MTITGRQRSAYSVIENSIIPVIDTNIADGRECIFRLNKSRQLALFVRSGSYVSLKDRRNNVAEGYFQNNKEKMVCIIA
jgi:hypothetical protein